MDIKAAVRAAIERCGREFTCEKSGETRRFTACVLPRSSAQTGENDEARLGQADAGGFTFYGADEGDSGCAEEGDVLRSADGERFELGACQDFYCGEVRLFRRAPAWKVKEGFVFGPF